VSKWAERFIQMAEFVAQWSKDPSTKCGAVIVGEDNEVLATGFNGFPRGVAETREEVLWAGDGEGWTEQVLIKERWERPGKYEWVEHAERNAIYNAARTGVRTAGATMYLNYAVECCADCTRAIIQSGIRRVVGPTRAFPGKGKGTHYDKCGANKTMMEEAGILVENVDADV
jgi:dCMP deaminase